VTVAYTIEVDKAQIGEAQSLFEFVGGNSGDALRIAANKSTGPARTLASVNIRKQVRLPASYVKDLLFIINATRGNPIARIRAFSRGLLLTRFSTDPLISGEKASWIKPPLVPSGGIRVKIKPDDAPKIVAGNSETIPNKPFYIVLNSGQNIGIAARRKQSGPRGGTIKVFHGPSLSQVFRGVRDEILDDAAEIFQRQMLDSMRYLLAKKYPPSESLVD
jgi:hypothetical protein